ncbi:MAG: hypothetical protein ABEH66_05415 [Halobacteriales archaeon]
MERTAAIDRIEDILETIETETMPVPVREVWVYGDVALGLDPIEELSVYLAKDVLLRGDEPERTEEFEGEYGIQGVGRTVRAEWAEQFPQYLRANDAGYAAPEQCLAAHLLPEGEPIHLEVCNTGFEDNVTQRMEGAMARGAYEEILDPRGVCLWVEGERSPTALDKLRGGELVFPTLPEALEMLGMDESEAREAAEAIETRRDAREGASVRGDVV